MHDVERRAERLGARIDPSFAGLRIGNTRPLGSLPPGSKPIKAGQPNFGASVVSRVSKMRAPLLRNQWFARLCAGGGWIRTSSSAK